MQVVKSGGNLCDSSFSPYPVSWRWWHIDDQGPWQLLYLHCEQQRCVWHLLKLLFDKLILCCLLEIFGFRDFVHKSQNLLSSLPSPRPVKRGLEEETEWWVNVMPDDLVFRICGKKHSDSHLGLDVSVVCFMCCKNEHSHAQMGMLTFSPFKNLLDIQMTQETLFVYLPIHRCCRSLLHDCTLRLSSKLLFFIRWISTRGLLITVG